MSTYLYSIHALLIVFVLVMFRHSVFRTRFFLHMFQQNGYKGGEYRKWLKENWNSHVLTSTYAVYNLLLLVMLYVFRSKLTLTSAAIIICLSGITWFFSASTYRKKEKKPLAYTPRLKRQLIPVVLCYLLLPVYGSHMSYQNNDAIPDVYLLAFTWVMADILIPFIVLFTGWVLHPVERRVQHGFIQKARTKLAAMPQLKIIAITGSYGKTSTKFMIKTVLQERFNVCFTPGSFNTPMGICKVINDELNASHQILVLEMGARYKGNIAELCRIAPPHIAVITNIGIAHLETFGSRAAIAQTKTEMLAYLPPGGTAVLNSDDEMLMNHVKRNDLNIIKAGSKTGIYSVDNLTYDENGSNFTIRTVTNETVSVSMPLLGVHNIENLLLAFGVGEALGLRMHTLAIAAGRLQPVEHRLELKKTGDGVIIIDDAFNSNPVGARSAVDVLAAFNTGRRIIVTPGMVELGPSEEDENRKFGDYIAGSGIDLVLLIGKKQTKPILEGLSRNNWPAEKVKVLDTLFEANDFLRSTLRTGDVVLYENDLPDTYTEVN